MTSNGYKYITRWIISGMLVAVSIYSSAVRSADNDTQETGIYSALSLGTAWAVTRKHVVTNYHVIANTSNLRLVTPNQLEIPVKLVASDPKNDLAILVVQGKTRLGSALPVSSKVPVLGTAVFTIGYPHPDLMGTSPKLTAGHINALSGIADDPRIYQVDVPVQSGNSGGPLLNMHGEVVAIITSKLNSKKLFERTGDIPQNVNYAIKIDRLRTLLNKANIESEIKQTGYYNIQTLETLAGQSLSSVLIIAGDTPDGKRNTVVYSRPAKQKIVENKKPVKIKNSIKTKKYAIYSYAEPGKYDEEENISGSNTINTYSESTYKLIYASLNYIQDKNVKIIRHSGQFIKNAHYKLENKYSLKSYCNKDDADIIISSYSEDNSGRGQHFRDVSFLIADCKSRRFFKKQYTIRRDELNDSFGYEMNLYDVFKAFLISVPPFIAMQSPAPYKIQNAIKQGKYVIYAYAQPGHDDEEDNVAGSRTVNIYSQNTSKLMKTHVNNLRGKNTSIKAYSGRYYKDVHNELGDKHRIKHHCSKNDADNIISSFSENSGGRFIHSRDVTYIIVNCRNYRQYKKQYHIERDEINDSFGYEMALHGTFKDFLIKTPPFISR